MQAFFPPGEAGRAAVERARARLGPQVDLAVELRHRGWLAAERFAHTTAYVATSLEAAGLAVRAVHRVVLRVEWGRPEWGLVYVVGRQEDEEEGGDDDDDDGYTHVGTSVGSGGNGFDRTERTIVAHHPT